jgi:hypothetical protein
VSACGPSTGQITFLPTVETSALLTTETQPQTSEEENRLPEATAAPTPVRDTDMAYSTSDRPDEVSGYQVHFVYALPSDGTDDFLDINGRIELSANAMNDWLANATGGSRLRYDTYDGNLDISFMQLDYTADEVSRLGLGVLALMDYEIKVRGFDTSRKLYVVYYDGQFVSQEGYCGLANYPPDGAGVTAVLLLRAYIPRFDQPCPRQFTNSPDFTGFYEMTILHEVMHLMGIAPACGTNVSAGHVTDSQQDLMYGEYDGSYSPLYTVLDHDNDDYYLHGIPGCLDFSKSVFLEPLPQDAELPPGWEISSEQVGPNPLETEPNED